MNRRRIEELAAEFWEGSGQGTMFPRTIEGAVLWANTPQSPSIRRLEHLSPAVIQHWLEVRDYPLRLQTSERALNGCLAAYRGAVFIFLEQDLSVADQNMVLAHELGHYLGHYQFPRERLRRRLGPDMLRVYDSDRQATPAEHIAATLAHVPLDVHVHYMDRLAGGTYAEPVNHAERLANRLAFELLAPWRAVLSRAKERPAGQKAGRDWAELLEHDFGLPREWAHPYARDLALLARGRRTFSEILGL
jgi:Zn-dependent peptidase ImmA (M78 family)